MSAYNSTGKFRGGRKVNAAVAYTDYLDMIGEAVRRIAARTPGGIKGVARAANCNERTLENIAQKRHGPNGFTLYQLQRYVPGFESELRRLSGDEFDPETERDINDLIRRAIRREALKADGE